MKKLLSILMAMLMLAVPTLGLADADAMVMAAVEAGRRAETTITLSLGEQLPLEDEIKSLVTDITDALELVVYNQDTANAEAGFALNLSGKSILTGKGTVADDVLYLASNLLGERAVAVAGEDVVPLVGRFIDLLVLMEAVDKDEAEMYKAMIEEGVNMAISEMPALDMELDWSETDFTGFLTVLEGILNSAQVEAVTMQPRNCDPATEKGRIVVTGDDVLGLWQAVETVLDTTPDLKEMLDGALSTSGMSTDALVSEVKALLEQLAVMVPDGLVMDMYVNDNGELVSMTMLAEVVEPGTVPAKENIVVGTIGEAATVQNAPASGKGEMLAALGAQYNRLTLNDGVAHTVNLEMEVEGEILSLSINVLAKSNGFVCNIGMALDGETMMTLAMSADTQETATTVQDAISYQVEINDGYETISFGVTYDAKSEQTGVDVLQNKTIKINVMGMDLLTVQGETKTMAPVEAIDTTTALRLATCSEEEFQGWFVNVVNGLQFWLVEVLQALPASVLQLVLGA